MTGLAQLSRVDEPTLRDIDRHARALRWRYRLKGFGYERALELPLIASYLRPRFGESLRYLDIGSGPSIFPSWVATQSRWDVTCLDKFDWVKKQDAYARKLSLSRDRYRVVVRNFLEAELAPESFDIITNISVIEHFDGENDALAMEKSARLLRPGGLYVITAPLNEGYGRDWYVQRDVYGEKFRAEPVFYQRHYDTDSFQRRVVVPSGLREVERKYFGDYGESFFNDRLVEPAGLGKLTRVWAQMNFIENALRHGGYSDQPVSMPGMKIYTSAGVCAVLTK